MTFASHLFWLNCIRKLSDFDLVYLVKVEFSRELPGASMMHAVLFASMH